MRLPGLALAVLLLGPALLAGCADPESRRQEVPARAVPAAQQPNRGILLRVLVINDEYLPVPSAKVVLVGLGVNGTTDDWGDAFFHIAKPGRYALHVHRAGFYPNQTKVVLDDADTSPIVRVWLRDAPHDANYADVYYYAGLCGPTAYVQGVTARADCSEAPYFPKPQARFILGRGLVGGYVELDWDRHQAGAEAMRLEVRFPDLAFSDGKDTLVAEGTSPVGVAIPPELLTPAHLANGNRVVATAGLAQGGPLNHNVQQEFSIQAVFEYFVAAPDVDPDS